MSNRLDCLRDILIERFLETDVLRTVIIIPSNTAKEFILQHFISRLGHVFGIRFLTLPQAVEYFSKLTLEKTTRPPEHLSLMLHIETLLRKSPSSELKDYLQGDEEKLLSLAEELSHVFLHYGLYGGQALKEWEAKNGWQQELLEELKKSWDFPYTLLRNLKPPTIAHSIHIFDPVHIPALYSSFFSHLSKFWETSLYFRSPTPLYWGDLLGERALAKDPELESYNLETNPLLANFGGLGKRLYSQLAESDYDEIYLPYPRDSALGNLKQDVFDLTTTLARSDETLEIYSCPTKMHEMELLLENLKKAGGENVLVFAPNINDYFPYIQFVFEKESSPFGYVVSDLSLTSQNSYMHIISHFFSLVESRFEPEPILELLSSPHFKLKEDLSLLHKITDRVEWGYNREMREEFLESTNISDVGTWEECFRSLLAKLAYTSSPIELSKAENLGNLISLLEGLYQDLWGLKKKNAPLKDWSKSIEALLEKYFVYSEEVDAFLSKLHFSSAIPGEFSYKSIKRVLTEIFEEEKETKAFLAKPAVHFASLKDGAISDADVICLIGVDEDSFPRKSTFRSINQLKYAKGADIQPEQGEKDRYLLLQALLSAKKRVFISYVNISPKDGKEVGPSLLIDNLSPIIPSPLLTTETISSIVRGPASARTPPKEISISSLTKLARNPMQFYCNETLGIYLDEKEEKSEFLLSYREKAELRNKALHEDLDELVRNSGVLFQEEAKEELQEEVSELKSHLALLGLTPQEFSTLRFDLSCQKPTVMADGSTIYPAIEIDGIKIYGDITRVTPKGLFVFGKSSFSEYWKHLPELLLLAHMKLPHTLLFGKDGKEKPLYIPNPKEALSSYLSYYLEALNSVSPLLPEQAEKLYKGKKMGEPSSFFENPYLNYIQPDLSRPWEKTVGMLCANLSL